MSKLPYMPLYVMDVLCDMQAAAMTPAEFGAYMRLLFHAWIEGGLPNDPRILASLTRAGDEWPSLAGVVMGCFHAADDGLLYNARLEDERQKLDGVSEARSHAGRLGGRPRKQTESTEKANENQNESIGFDLLKQNESKAKAKKSYSESESETDREREITRADASPAGNVAADGDAEESPESKTQHSPANEREQAAGYTSITEAVNDSPRAQDCAESGRRIEIPAAVEQAVFETFGGPQATWLREWLSAHPPGWIIEALKRTQAAKSRSPQYTSVILADWEKKGYPENNHGRTGKAASDHRPATARGRIGTAEESAHADGEKF